MDSEEEDNEESQREEEGEQDDDEEAEHENSSEEQSGQSQVEGVRRTGAVKRKRRRSYAEERTNWGSGSESATIVAAVSGKGIDHS